MTKRRGNGEMTVGVSADHLITPDASPEIVHGAQLTIAEATEPDKAERAMLLAMVGVPARVPSGGHTYRYQHYHSGWLCKECGGSADDCPERKP